MKDIYYQTIFDGNENPIGFVTNNATLDYEFRHGGNDEQERQTGLGYDARKGIPVSVQIIAHYSKNRRDCDKLGI